MKNRLVIALAVMVLGVAATAQAAGALQLAWDPNPEPNIAGYTLYYGTASHTYTNTVSCGNVTTCTVSGLTEGQQYFFAVQAVNTSGLLSPLSLEVSGTVPVSGVPASLTAPSQGSTLSGSSVQFQWNAGTNVTDYKLSVGTSLGGTNIFNQDEGTNHSATVGGLPVNGSPVYVRLWSLIAAVWNFKDYTFTSFTVPPTLTVSPTSLQAGATINVTLANGPGNPTDWFALVPASAADGAYVAWQYVNGLTLPPSAGATAATVHFVAPATAGTYNVRFFANGSFTKLATSATITVSAAAPPPPPSSTITLSSTTLNAGATFTATIANGPGNATDWVGLYASGAADGAYLAWKYFNGSTIPPSAGSTSGSVQFTAPTTAGTYNVRLFSNGTLNKVATSATITVTAAAPPPPPPSGTITLSTTTVNPGATIAFSVSNGPGNATDWVGLYPSSAADAAYMSWEFLNGSTIPPSAGSSSASLHFTAPTTPGTYNLRWFANGGWTKIATSATITVSGSAPPPPPPPSASVSLSATTVSPGAVFSVTLANGPANATDWAGLYATSAANSGYISWEFMNGLTLPPASGAAGATVRFAAPLTPGTYNVRWFSNNTFNSIATSGTLTVQAAATPAIAVSATTVSRGATFTATVTNGPGNATDWIGLYQSSAADGAYIAWKFLNGATFPPASGTTSATVSFTAPTTPGTYNIRLFSNNSYNKVATSVTITVP